jgi:outer membrane murein-binding lipoprotein Lpp
MEKEHLEVLLEQIRDNVQLIAEGHTALAERMDRDKTELKQEIRSVATRVDRLETKVDKLDSKVDKLETKVDELDSKIDKLETKVDKLDSKVDKLETKVDKLDKGLRSMKKQIASSIEIQADRGARLERLEKTLADHLDEHP